MAFNNKGIAALRARATKPQKPKQINPEDSTMIQVGYEKRLDQIDDILDYVLPRGSVDASQGKFGTNVTWVYDNALIHAARAAKLLNAVAVKLGATEITIDPKDLTSQLTSEGSVFYLPIDKRVDKRWHAAEELADTISHIYSVLDLEPQRANARGSIEDMLSGTIRFVVSELMEYKEKVATAIDKMNNSTPVSKQYLIDSITYLQHLASLTFFVETYNELGWDNNLFASGGLDIESQEYLREVSKEYLSSEMHIILEGNILYKRGSYDARTHSPSKLAQEVQKYKVSKAGQAPFILRGVNRLKYSDGLGSSDLASLLKTQSGKVRGRSIGNGSLAMPVESNNAPGIDQGEMLPIFDSDEQGAAYVNETPSTLDSMPEEQPAYESGVAAPVEQGQTSSKKINMSGYNLDNLAERSRYLYDCKTALAGITDYIPAEHEEALAGLLTMLNNLRSIEKGEETLKHLAPFYSTNPALIGAVEYIFNELPEPNISEQVYEILRGEE